MATNSHTQQGGVSSRILLPVALLALALGGGIAAQPGASAPVSHTQGAYGWPVKPFDRQHPVRGNFGDPRTVFGGPPTQRTLLSGSGSFTFHFGVDISAPDGTAVYPVESGTVTTVMKDWVQVDCGGGRLFQYWHVAPTVSNGQRVDMDSTVLGHVIRGTGHVHLSEFEGGVPVNPLAPGHLSPYTDTTVPVVRSISFRASVASPDEMPELLRGRVEILVDAYDMPSLRVPGAWADLPVAPALLEWRIERAAGGKVVVPTRVAFDVRDHLPPATDFWGIYARGSHQNMSVFGKHYSYMQPGVYLYRLASGGFDTRTLPDSVYNLVVTATDIRGNQTTVVQRFSVHNRPGVVGA